VGHRHCDKALERNGNQAGKFDWRHTRRQSRHDFRRHDLDGGSVVGAANVAKYNGPRSLRCRTHAVLCGPAIERLRDSPIKEVIVTDSIPLPPTSNFTTLKVISVAPLLADAVKRIHLNESVSTLFE